MMLKQRLEDEKKQFCGLRGRAWQVKGPRRAEVFMWEYELSVTKKRPLLLNFN